MQRRMLGRTSLEVSEIGFGGWGIGKSMWGRTEDAESMQALKAAVDAGINYFDTAAAYGHGHSERLIGRLSKELGAAAGSLVVSTKIPPRNMEWPASRATPLKIAFPPDWIEQSVENSLRNLRFETLPLEQFHVFSDHWLKDPLWPEVAAAFDRLKRQGKIRFVGASLNSDDPESASGLIESGFVDQVQVLFNIFDQRAADRLFGLCRGKGVGVVVRCPFDEGGLTGDLRPGLKFDPQDFRSHYFGGERLAETCRRVEALKPAVLGSKAPTLAVAAIKFALSFPEVSTVIPGMRRESHVRLNAAAADGNYYSPAELAAIAKHRWVRDFYA